MPITKLKLPGERPRYQELYEALRLALVDGTLRPGERLIESDLAKIASVSRTPVREAIRKLEADGLVRQTTVGVEVVAASATEVREFCEIRETLEGMACRLAAGSRSELGLLELQRIEQAYQRAVEAEALDDIVDVNRHFHETIWRLGGNEALVKLLTDLRARIDAMQPTTSLRDHDRQLVAMEEHTLFIEALTERDETRAETIAREHFRNSMAIRLTMAEESPTD